jgi:hypothetical protein
LIFAATDAFLLLTIAVEDSVSAISVDAFVVLMFDAAISRVTFWLISMAVDDSVLGVSAADGLLLFALRGTYKYAIYPPTPSPISKRKDQITTSDLDLPQHVDESSVSFSWSRSQTLLNLIVAGLSLKRALREATEAL